MGPAPDANDRWMLLQAVLGAWPNELLDEEVDPAAVEGFRSRMEEYARKALREGKRHTSWVNVNEPYEEAALAVLRAILAPDGDFFGQFRSLAQKLAFAGMLTGLSRTVLKCTLPGVPDVYQGTEFWDFSLVDPDNRRPVDYEARARALEEESDWRTALDNWLDGRIKQQVLARLLADRAAAQQLYGEGDYQPLEVEGERARQVLAFRRSHGSEDLIVAVPRLIAGSLEGGTPPFGDFWGDTVLRVPAGARRNVLTGAEVRSGEGGLPLRELFSALPIGVLRTIR